MLYVFFAFSVGYIDDTGVLNRAGVVPDRVQIGQRHVPGVQQAGSVSLVRLRLRMRPVFRHTFHP